MADIVTQRPVSTRKGTAKPTAEAAKGAFGHALALACIKAAEKDAAFAEKQKESRKDTLKRLETMTQQDHTEFRTVLEARIQQVRDVAAGLGMSVAQYRAGDSVSNGVVSDCNMWQKMSRAVSLGFTPDYTQGWTIISMAATDALAAQASVNRPNTGTEDDPATGSPTARRGRKALTNLEKAQKYLSDMPLQDLSTIYQWLGSFLEEKQGSIRKPARTAKPAQAPAQAAANEPQERAVARTRRGAEKPVA